MTLRKNTRLKHKLHDFKHLFFPGNFPAQDPAGNFKVHFSKAKMTLRDFDTHNFL